MVFFSVIVLGLLSHVLRAWRWNIILQTSGNAPGVFPAFLAVMTGYLFNYGIPRSGELARCGLLLRTNNTPLEISIGSVVAERLIDLLTLIIIVVVAFILQFDPLWNLLMQLKQNQTVASQWIMPLFIIFGILGLALGYILLKNPAHWKWVIPFQQKTRGFLNGLTSIRKMKNPWLFMALSMGIWILYLLMMYFSFFNLPQTSHLGMAEALTVLAVGTFGMVIPTPGGVGAFHYFTQQALMLYAISDTHGLAYATVVHGAQMIMFLVLGPICLVLASRIEKRNLKNV